MANDITNAKAGPIKNGTMIHSCNKYGTLVKTDTYVNNRPILNDIENKFAERFDDPSYYYGGVGTDGGNIGDLLGT